MKRLILLASAVVVSGCSTIVKIPPAATPLRPDKAVERYALVLKNHVNDKGQVDFESIKADPRPLEDYVSFVAATPLSEFASADEKLAHLLNAYNALSIYNVIDAKIPKTHAGLKKVGFFFLRKMPIGGKTMSLHTFENDYIRSLKDPRVHFALNCMAVSCPRLPKTPFYAKSVQKELKDLAGEFFAEPRNLKIDKNKKTATVSEILSFFTKDFISDKTPTLISYINQWISEPMPNDFKVKFFDYDWTVNNSRTLGAAGGSQKGDGK